VYRTWPFSFGCIGTPVSNDTMRSLNARITLGAGIVLAVFIAASAFALERAFRDSARNARQERLLAQVYLLLAAAEVDTRGGLTLSGGVAEPRLELPGSGLYAAVFNAGGRAVWQSRSGLAVPAPFATALPAGTQRFETRDGFFVQGYGISWNTAGGSFPFTVSVAEDMTAYRDQLNVYRRSLWGWLGAMALLLLAAQWLTLRWGLAPLRRVADELTRLEQGEQQDISGRYPSEVQRLADNLNTLLLHERAQQKRYRDALADLAHSLKTPLALMRGTLRESAPDAASTRVLDEQIGRMDAIVGYHLQRAAASGRSRLAAPQPLKPAVERILAALAKVHAGKPVATEVDADDALHFRGDEGDLTEVLGNLLDNAWKWCRGRLRVAAAVQDRVLTLTVEDDGPGIADADAQRVLQRGARADQSVPGHGIGLAVVRDIVAAYDGDIRISRSALGGTAVTLTLPGSR
jgi:two-component system, OmpR family, sensor histidine kinase PhoQ